MFLFFYLYCIKETFKYIFKTIIIMPEEDEVKITYNTLFEILKREKDREEIQKLDNNFIQNLVSYLNEKKRVIEKEQKDLDFFSEEEKNKLMLQLQNIKKLIRDLYDRREKKIIAMALNKSRTGSSLIDTTNLLPIEKKLFEELVEILQKFRKENLFKIINEYKLPENISPQEPKELKTQENPTRIRLMDNVPEFAGTDLKIYGPYEKDQVVELPKEIADLLISTNKAVEVD